MTEAERRDMPALLSVGYSSHHWRHVQPDVLTWPRTRSRLAPLSPRRRRPMGGGDRSPHLCQNPGGEPARHPSRDPCGERHTTDSVPLRTQAAQAGQGPRRQGLRLLPPTAHWLRERGITHHVARKRVESSQRLGRPR